MPTKKDAPLAFRIPKELKEDLQGISKKEARSLSQICEILLRIGVQQYRRSGARFLDEYLERRA